MTTKRIAHMQRVTIDGIFNFTYTQEIFNLQGKGLVKAYKGSSVLVFLTGELDFL